MMYIIVGLVAVLIGCVLILLRVYWEDKKRKAEEKEFYLYQELVKQFYDMLGESPDTLPVPYSSYHDMKQLVNSMRQSIVNNKSCTTKYI